MGIYTEKQRLLDAVSGEIEEYRELIGPENPEKKEKYGFVPGLRNMENEEKALDSYLKTLREGIFQVLFTGGFNAGKSTLLNALMRKMVLRTNISAETAVITKIVFNAEEKVIVYRKQIDKKTGLPKTETYTVEEFFERFRVSQERPDLFDDVDYVQLQQSQDGIGGSMVQLVDSPGTLNSKEDTEVSRRFAEKASAIVYLINSSMPFVHEDKEYIRTHFEGRGMKNLFFVFNRFDSLNPGDREDLKERARQQLRKVFTVNGAFDEELFKNRVFYTNAYGSMNTRTGRDTPTPFGNLRINDESTGVPGFEEALGKFLASGNRDRDAFAAAIPRLAAVYKTAKTKAAQEISMYREGREKLKKDQENLRVSMEKIERILQGIENTCLVTATELVGDIKRDYDSFVLSVESGWDSHFESPGVLDRIDFNTMDMIKLALTRDLEKKKARIKPIQEEIQKYVESASAQLGRNIKESIEAKTKKLETSLKLYQDQLDSLETPININEILNSIASVLAPNEVHAPGLRVNTFQLLLGIIGTDPEIAVDALSGVKSNKEAVISSICKNVFEYIAVFVVAWPIGIAMLVKRAYDIIKGWKQGGKDGAKELLKGMKPEIIGELRTAKTQLAMDMEKKIGGGFIRAGRKFSDSFRTELSNYEKSFEEMLKNLNDTEFNIQAEQERIDLLLKRIAEKISHVSELVKNEELTEEEILQIAEGKDA